MHTGWIKQHRKILDHPINKKSQYFHLWINLLLLAEYEKEQPTRPFIWNNETIVLKPGQLLTGRHKLATLTGIPEGTIEKILKYLEKEQQIEQQKTTKFRLISIKNWVSYQGKEQQIEQQAVQQRIQQNATSKEDKKFKEEKDITKVFKNLPKREPHKSWDDPKPVRVSTDLVAYHDMETGETLHLSLPDLRKHLAQKTRA